MRRQQPTAPSLPAAHAAARAPANDTDPRAALAVAARWCAATHATEHRARPSIVDACNALEAARDAPSPATLGALSTALLRWCEAASARGNAVDLAPAMLSAVNAAAALDAAAELTPVEGAETFAQWLRAGLSVPEPWRSNCAKHTAEAARQMMLGGPRLPRGYLNAPGLPPLPRRP